jgi:hypothetical protein
LPRGASGTGSLNFRDQSGVIPWPVCVAGTA